MPNWGTSGDLTEAQVDLMARYLLNDPGTPPEFGMAEVRAPGSCCPRRAAPDRG